jgi:hypothetical protein
MKTKTIKYTQFCGSFLERRGKSWRYRVVGIGEIEIQPGEKIAVHLTQTGLFMIVVGRNPAGPRNGLSGTWLDGRLVAVATKDTAWVRELLWKLVMKLSISGDDEQRLWATQLLLDSTDKVRNMSCRIERMVQS